MPVNPDDLDKALNAIRKEYGPGSVRPGDAYHSPERISTGALELDIITRGGIPIGRWSHFYGGMFSAKTLIAFKSIANAQKMGQNCAYYNAEKQFDPDWARLHGVNVEELVVVESSVIEEIGNSMELLMGSVHYHVIDSIPAATSVDELAASLEDWRPGISARAWGKTMKRVQTRFGDDNTVLMINHLGTVFGKYAGGDEPKGGRFLEYLSSLSIEFQRKSWLFYDKTGHLQLEGESGDTLDKRDKSPTGIEFACRVKKSRVSVPLKPARLRLDFQTGTIDDDWSLAKAAEFNELVVKNGSWFTLPDETKVQGDGQLRDYISNNPEFRQKIIDVLKSDS